MSDAHEKAAARMVDIASHQGGPAFPSTVESNTGTMFFVGMTVRDYFAAAAFQGLLADGAGGSDADLASIAFRLADAMMAERERQ